MEGARQAEEDAVHWLGVYTEMLRDLEPAIDACPDLAPRLLEMRRRLRFWRSRVRR